MTTMDKTSNWIKLTHFLSSFSLNLRASLLDMYLYFKIIIAFVNVHTRGEEEKTKKTKNLSLMNTMYGNV